MVGPKTTSSEYRQTPVGQCFDALTSSHPEDTLGDPKAAESNSPPSEFPFSGRYTPHASAHSGKCSDHLEQSTFSPDILKHMPETIVLPHTEVSQQQIKKDCLTTTLKITREGKKMPEKMQRGFHTYFLADTKGIGLKRGFPQFDNVAGAKRKGHQTFSGEMTARRALSYTLCMLKAGYAVPLGVSYLNNTVSNTGVNHWIVAYGYAFVPTEDGLQLKILAHDVGIIKNSKTGDDRHVEFLVDTTGRLYKPGPHNKRPAVRGGQEVTAIGMPFEIKPLLPTT